MKERRAIKAAISLIPVGLHFWNDPTNWENAARLIYCTSVTETTAWQVSNPEGASAMRESQVWRQPDAPRNQAASGLADILYQRDRQFNRWERSGPHKPPGAKKSRSGHMGDWSKDCGTMDLAKLIFKPVHFLELPIIIPAQRREKSMRPMAILTCLLAMTLPAQSKIVSEAWGTAPNGKAVSLYTLTNANGIEARISNFGGVIVSIRAPDRSGKFANIVQGFDTLAPYIDDPAYYGAIIGRYANRIAGAQFTLNGTTYHLTTVNGEKLQIHGGPNGYSRRVWQATIKEGSTPSLTLRLIDPDGEMGFPGEVKVAVTYTLTPDNRVHIDYRATTNKSTVINLTNHSYFSLAGQGPGTVDSEKLQIFADKFAPADTTGMPLGEIRPVVGTDFDFTKPTVIGQRLASRDIQMRQENGLDHMFAVNGEPGALRKAVRLSDPGSGRVLEVWTTQPGVQVFAANSVQPSVRESRHYEPHGALAFETQHYPNSPNQPNFPSTVITPDNPLHEVTEFRFLTD
jgi:aldose 1-epimerase